VLRVVIDLVAARPVHLAIIDGIESMAGGEGPWIPKVRRVKPGVLIAGTNCVSTDVVATAIMGFGPMAERGTPPFEKCNSTLQLAEHLGVGTRDLRRIEVVGTPIANVKMVSARHSAEKSSPVANGMNRTIPGAQRAAASRDKNLSSRWFTRQSNVSPRLA